MLGNQVQAMEDPLIDSVRQQISSVLSSDANRCHTHLATVERRGCLVLLSAGTKRRRELTQ